MLSMRSTARKSHREARLLVRHSSHYHPPHFLPDSQRKSTALYASSLHDGIFFSLVNPFNGRSLSLSLTPLNSTTNNRHRRQPIRRRSRRGRRRRRQNRHRRRRQFPTQPPRRRIPHQERFPTPIQKILEKRCGEAKRIRER